MRIDRRMLAVAGSTAALTVRAYEPIDGGGFGIRLQPRLATGRISGRLLRAVTEVVTQRYAGTYLTGSSSEDWSEGKFPKIGP